MNTSLTTDVPTGPRGGNLGNPDQHPERRNASYQDNGTGFHNSQPKDTATMGLQKEQAWHKMAAYMLLAGRTNSEIAIAAGVTPQTVSILRGQRWFQENLAALGNEQGQDLAAAITTHAHDAINRIAEIASGDIETYGVRNILSASQTILDHAKGKAVQSIVSHSTHSHASPSEEMESIQQQLVALRSSSSQTKTLELVPASQ